MLVKISEKALIAFPRQDKLYILNTKECTIKRTYYYIINYINLTVNYKNGCFIHLHQACLSFNARNKIFFLLLSNRRKRNEKLVRCKHVCLESLSITAT